MRSFIAVTLLALGLAAAAGACSSSSSDATPPPPNDDSADAGADDGGGPVGYPAPHPAMPVAQTLGGAVMTAPKLVAISFMGDPLQASVDNFVTQLASATAYWSGATAEYGVGPLTATPPVHLGETAPSMQTDAQVQQWLKDEINGVDGGAAFPQPDANTQYLIFYPSGSNVTSNGGSLCQEFQGYHSSFALSATTNVVYSVVGRCKPPVAGLAAIDEVTAEAAHEIIEAATDPLPFAGPAWATLDDADDVWAVVGGGGELGDLCAPFPGVFFRPPGVDNLVQRVWSNAASKASHDPCQPQGVSPYFNSAPVMKDMVQVTGAPGGSFTGLGVKIPIGKSKTIELDLYSDAPTSGPWTVSALDLNSAFFGGDASLEFTFDKTTGQNGDKIMLTIKAVSAGVIGASPFWIQNKLGSQTTIWTGLVGQ
ncbi:MAG TPA: hypothetical protein VIF62_17350 [Labilithrix sp.]